jgi:two-component system CheB/CheR fusion protein
VPLSSPRIGASFALECERGVQQYGKAMAQRQKTAKRPRRSRKQASAAKSIEAAEGTKKGCPIVGIGGSAGGFEAAKELLQYLSPRNGMAFVIVQHLDPHHTSQLANLLAKATPMRVIEINRPIKPDPNTVYVQPHNKCVRCKDGTLTLVRRTERMNLAIDHFFESLAEAQGPRAIGIVLSGTGSDGTAGLRAIKAAGGITFAQDESSAKFAAMPRNAVLAGFVDAALSPKEIASELEKIAGHPYIKKARPGVERPDEPEVDLDDLGRIFLSLRKHTGVDFTAYKQSTLQRRIQRRMALHRIERLRQYANFLRGNTKEIHELFNDLLINVTRFFRDEQTFRALTKKFIPALLKLKKKARDDLRIWVPGCATGEEVYSLAICILESLGESSPKIRVQIFGTDLSETAIDRARLGIYSTAIEKDVPREYLQRYFKKLDSTYQINRAVRDLCTFARQNVTVDPPFSRLDLISCRNVLIYLGTHLQQRALPVFHYALKPGGYLLLGPSETVGVFGDLFELVDRRAKVYAKKVVRGRREIEFAPFAGLGESKSLEPARLSSRSESRDFNSQVQQVADRILLGTYTPSGVVIDEHMVVRQFRGKTGPYLEHIAGPASLNLLQMARPSLVPDLRATINQALRGGQPARKERAFVKRDSHIDEVNIEVVPFKVPNSDGNWMLVLFSEAGMQFDKAGGKRKKKAAKNLTRDNQVAQLRDELSATKESLQAIIEEQEATNEELTSANEEIESSNEELQSTNEELETAKEELQSTNEELTTLNEELSNRNIEIVQVNSDLNNLLSSVHLPIVMVDNALILRRATPTAYQAFNISDIDIGRRITELSPNIEITDLAELLREVIDTLDMRQRDVRDKTGARFSLRVRPYRTIDNKIDGAVITLVDLDRKKEARREGL